jgi:tetratricopeptide (TPR) repeat protein
MRVVPELVFVNCCHLAARSAAQAFTKDATTATTPLDRPRFAAGVAEELIRIGVRCVIAAGWAVDDGAASEFATRFYSALTRGRRFIDAVAEAREAAFAMGGNTWAAYQCYGDPDWYFVQNVSDAQRPTPSLADEFAGVASPKGLVLALETLAVRSKYQQATLQQTAAPGAEAQKAATQEQRTKIRHLEARFAPRWRDIGEVAEGFARAWDAAGDRAAAMKWYAQALGANDGTASLRVVEQLGDLRVRQAWTTADDAIRDFPRREKADARSGSTKSARGGQRGTARNAGFVKAAAALDAALGHARDEIAAALRILEQVTALQPTMERESLCGSAWKRLAMVEAAARNPRAETKAIEMMKIHYGRAEALARAGNSDGLFYPALNRMAAELVANAGKPGWRNFDPVAVADARASLAAKTRDDPDFWSVVGLTELRIYLDIADHKLATGLDTVLHEFDDLHARVSAPSEWSSVLDQLRFVLPKYEARATATERKAVLALTKYLDQFARAAAN